MKYLYSTKIEENTKIQHLNRVVSKNNTFYFLSSPATYYLESNFINSVDPLARILCHNLLQSNFKIKSFHEGFYFSKDVLAEKWNNIKKEERIIREHGLTLYSIDGKFTSFKDEKYRTFWPSFQSFVLEFPKMVENGWLVFETNNQNIIKLILDNKDTIFSFPVGLELDSIEDFTQFTVTLKSGESFSNTSAWRRLTQNLCSLLKQTSNESKGLK